MKSPCTIRRGQAAYTMVELMVAVLISVILMVAMYQIFARVQKVFTEGNYRGKMYEEGRAVMDLIVRDLEQIAPSGEGKVPRNFPSYNPEWGSPTPAPTLPVPDPEPIDYHPFYGCNFMAWPYTNHVLKVIEQPSDYSTWALETQQGWDAAISETLVSSRVEFFAQDVQWWVVGYRLYSQNNPTERNAKIIGALWRYESSPGSVGSLPFKVRGLRNNGGSLYQKLSDNVIHFRMRAVSSDDPGRVLSEKSYFDKHKIPLYVEVELGVIEERLKKEILNDAEVERYDVLLETDPNNNNLMLGRNLRVKKMLAANTDRILMLRQIVPITSAMGN